MLRPCDYRRQSAAPLTESQSLEDPGERDGRPSRRHGRGIRGLWAGVSIVAAWYPANPAVAYRGFEQTAKSGRQVEIVDRLVAVVDEDPILQSDLVRAIDFGLIEASSSPRAQSLERLALDRLVEQRLRAHEADRFDFSWIDPRAVDQQLEAIQERLGADFSARLERHGMTVAELRHLVSEQLRVLAYVEQRLEPGIRITPEAIEEYYERELRSALSGPPPPLAFVREEIRMVLKERQLNEAVRAWTRELRSKAHVQDWLDVSSPPTLLPVRGVLQGDEP